MVSITTLAVFAGRTACSSTPCGWTAAPRPPYRTSTSRPSRCWPLATAGDPALTPIADTLRERLSTDRRGAAGGYTGFTDDRFFQSDPHMHLFEAALAWEQLSPDPRWGALADEVAELCLARFMTSDGLLLEYFDAAWAPAAGLQGRVA